MGKRFIISKKFIVFMILCIAIYILLNTSYMINIINNTSMKKPKSQYDTFKTQGVITVPFHQIGRTLNYDVQIIESKEKNYIKINNKTFKPKDSYKYVLIKMKFKSIANDDDFDMYEFCYLTDVKANSSFCDDKTKLEQLIYEYKKKEDKSLIWIGKIKPGVIKYTYLLFEVPKSCNSNNLALVGESSTSDSSVLFKIN